MSYKPLRLFTLVVGLLISVAPHSGAGELSTTGKAFNSGAAKLGAASLWVNHTLSASLVNPILNSTNIKNSIVAEQLHDENSPAPEPKFSFPDKKDWDKRKSHYLSQSLPSGTIPFGVDVPQPAAPAADGIIENTVPPALNGKKSFALTLAGGGARGAAHIGVLKVLEREGLRPAFVSGSSIGAVIGSLYCAGVPVAEIEKLMLNGKVRKAFMPIPLKLQAAWSIPRDMFLRTLGAKPQVGFYSGKSLSKFIRKQMPPDVKTMEDMKIPFAVIATNILDTRATWIARGDIGEAVRASASIPFVYKPALFEGKAMVDGGMRANLPTDAARASGASVVVAVKLHSSLESKPMTDFRTMMEFSDRIMSIMMAEIESKNMSKADLLIEPNIDDFMLYSFDKDILTRAIAAGEKAAEEMLPQLRVALQPGPSRTAAKDKPEKVTH